MAVPWHRRSTHSPWYSNPCHCPTCVHARRCNPDSAPYAIVHDQENARDLLISRPQLAWVRRSGERGSFFRARLPTRRSALRRAEDELEREAWGIGLRGGGDSVDGEVCCCGAHFFDPLTRGCACCEERSGPRGRGRRRSEVCVHITRRRSWGWGRTTHTRRPPYSRDMYGGRTPFLDREDIQNRRPLSRGPSRPPRNRISNLADRFSDLALNLGRLSPPPFLPARRRRLRPSPSNFSRSRSRRRPSADRSPSSLRAIPIPIPRSRSRTRSILRARYAHSPRPRRFRRSSRSLSRSLTPPSRGGSLRLGTSRSPPPTVRFRTPTPSPPISPASISTFLRSRCRRGAVSAASGPPPSSVLADIGRGDRDHERERRPYLRRGSRLSPPPDRLPRSSSSFSRSPRRRSPSYPRGAAGGLLSGVDDPGELRRGRSMRRFRSPELRGRSGMRYLEDDGLALGFGSTGHAGLHLPRIQRHYAMPAARQRERELGFGGRLRGEEGWSD